MSMKRLNVFLSSAMTGELALERSALRVFFGADASLQSFSDLYAIEEHASPSSIEKAFVEEVKDAQVLVLLLNKELRPAVLQEFHAAKQHGVRPLVFIRDRTDKREHALESFISNEAYKYHCGSFSSEKDLCEKVRTALINDLLNTYRRTESERARGMPIVQLSKSPSDTAPLFDIAELDSLRAHPQVAALDSDELVILSSLHSTEKWDYKTALMLIELAITKDPGNWQAFHNKAQLLSEIGLERESLIFLNRALDLNPDSHPTLHNLGIHYYRQGKSDEARAYFLRALALFPKKFSSLSYLVNIAFQEKNYPEAECRARCAYEIEKGDLERCNLALAVALNGRVSEARELLTQGNAGSKEFLRASAYIEEIEGNVSGAIAIIDEFTRAYGLEHQLCVKKSYLLLRADRITELRGWLEFAERHLAFQASDYNNIGWDVYQRGADRLFAAALFEKALALDPTEVATWKNLQCCYLDTVDLPKAIEVSKRALKFHPNDPGVFGNLAQALLRSGKIAEWGDLLTDKAVSTFGSGLSTEQRDAIKHEVKNTTSANIAVLEQFVAQLMALSPSISPSPK